MPATLTDHPDHRLVGPADTGPALQRGKPVMLPDAAMHDRSGLHSQHEARAAARSPKEMEMPAPSFWDRIAPKYAQRPVGDPKAYDEKLARVAALLCAKDRVLEIGCGTGTTALRLAPGVATYTATDGSRAMIDIAKAKLGPDAPGNVTFLQADAAEKLSDAPFDAICAFSLLHLVEDLPAVLRAVHAQVKPGGLFVSKTVCLRETAFPIRLMVPALTAVGLAPPVAALSRAQLLREISAAGFDIETVTHFGPKRLNPFIVARKPPV